MLYILYLPKSKDELLKDRKIGKALKWYAKLTGTQYSIISAPGYLSTADNTINDYLSSLTNLLTNNRTIEVGNRRIGFLNGMNGHYNTTSGKNSIICEHKKHLGGSGFGLLNFEPKKDFDHRKMMFFFNDKDAKYSKITLDNLDSFLQDIHVGAVLIGSSNQSNTTYFQKCATKGEADVLLIDPSGDEEVQRVFNAFENGEQGDQNELFADDNIVIAKSFFGKGDTKTQEFMKDILRELLMNGLEK